MQGLAAGEPGARRKKLAGYLSAGISSANQVRQSAVNAYYGPPNPTDKRDLNVVDAEAGGAWTDADLRSRDAEEMVLFPSYARRRVPNSTSDHSRHASSQSTRNSIDDRRAYTLQDFGDDEKAASIIDADVRGWIYQPNTGPLTRKNKILMGLARQMCGLPVQGRGVTKEDQEAEKAAEYAMEGGAVTPVSPGVIGVGELTGHELDTAHGYLKSRLAPFMHRPIPNLSVTVFFYNSSTSQSRIITTDDYGHFSMRAGLPFIPTHVRVLASEKLKATEEIQLIEAHGISLISDIDDTIKHSAISLGAREIFRNTFIRELSTLVIPGIQELYTTLALLDVPIHYVSNSPWQIYPLIAEYFRIAKLPQGSFHLKQYTGMFQGIFEPVAERKKPSLERILNDFPARQFILFGDSGEADLEVYTEVALANPGRIKAVFIRDVTTKEDFGFFGSNGANTLQQIPPVEASSLSNYKPSQLAEHEEPEDLIDLSSSDDEGPEILKPMDGHELYHSESQPKPRPLSHFQDDEGRPPLPSRPSANKKPPPPRPNKPVMLRGRSIEKTQDPPASFSRPSPFQNETLSELKNESRKSTPTSSRNSPNASRGSSPAASIRAFLTKSNSNDDNPRREASPFGHRDSSPASSLRNLRLHKSPTDPQSSNGDKRDSISSISSLTQRVGSFPSVPSRHPNLRRAATAASSGYVAPPATEIYDPASGIDKKVWLWKQRWERAREVLEPRGIILESWRKGTDVLEIAVALVEGAKEEEERRLNKLKTRKDNNAGERAQ